MPDYKLYSFSKQDIEMLANDTKEAVAKVLVEIGFLEKAKADEFVSQYTLVMHTPGIFGKMFDAFTKTNKNDPPSLMMLRRPSKKV